MPRHRRQLSAANSAALSRPHRRWTDPSHRPPTLRTQGVGSAPGRAAGAAAPQAPAERGEQRGAERGPRGAAGGGRQRARAPAQRLQQEARRRRRQHHRVHQPVVHCARTPAGCSMTCGTTGPLRSCKSSRKTRAAAAHQLLVLSCRGHPICSLTTQVNTTCNPAQYKDYMLDMPLQRAHLAPMRGWSHA